MIDLATSTPLVLEPTEAAAQWFPVTRGDSLEGHTNTVTAEL